MFHVLPFVILLGVVLPTGALIWLLFTPKPATAAARSIWPSCYQCHQRDQHLREYAFSSPNDARIVCTISLLCPGCARMLKATPTQSGRD